MKKQKLIHEWIRTLIEGLDAEVDDNIREKLMYKCGRTCALYHDSIRMVREIQQKVKNIDELLDEINKRKDFWCGIWERDGDTIYSICEDCGCPLIREGLIGLSPTFCECSLGYVKAVFEMALERPVKVELESAIGRGDKVCKFVVLPDK